MADDVFPRAVLDAARARRLDHIMDMEEKTVARARFLSGDGKNHLGIAFADDSFLVVSADEWGNDTGCIFLGAPMSEERLVALGLVDEGEYRRLKAEREVEEAAKDELRRVLMDQRRRE